MLDLALALVWTPLGLAALAAAAAAVAAFLYLPRAGVPLLALAVVLAGSAYVARLQGEVEGARRERDEARAEAAAQARAAKAVERVTAKAASRARSSRAARDRILTAPAGDDGPVAPVLRQVLEGDR